MFLSLSPAGGEGGKLAVPSPSPLHAIGRPEFTRSKQRRAGKM